MENPTIPGYTVGEKLGQGSYATVYKALSAGPGPSGVREVYAIKCIDKSLITSRQSAADNLVREISILKTLRHRHIVQMMDFRWDKRYIYLILEYCSGGDLSSFIRQHKSLPELVARKFLRQLALAMKYLRDEGIAHMDLKPQNLLLSSRHHPVLKVADFGFAQHLRSDTDSGTSYRGSPLYMAPEILTRHFYDAKVDLWSIGVILHECIFGRAPFSCSSMEELKKLICSPGPVKIEDTGSVHTSDSCRDLLEGLLRRNPNHRFNFDEFFSHPFVAVDRAPSDESLPRATELVQEAVAADQGGRHSDAVKLYCEAIDFFLSALQIVETQSAKDGLRKKIRAYLRRAEQLKNSMKPTEESVSVKSQESLSEIDLIRQEWSDAPQVGAAFTVISAAEALEREEKWEEAKLKYHLAVESMLQLLSSEPSSRRKELLKKRVEKWLSRAEMLQDYVEVMQLNLSKVEEKEQAVMEVEEDTNQLAQTQQCSIQ